MTTDPEAALTVPLSTMDLGSYLSPAGPTEGTLTQAWHLMVYGDDGEQVFAIKFYPDEEIEGDPYEGARILVRSQPPVAWLHCNTDKPLMHLLGINHLDPEAPDVSIVIGVDGSVTGNSALIEDPKLLDFASELVRRVHLVLAALDLAAEAGKDA